MTPEERMERIKRNLIVGGISLGCIGLIIGFLIGLPYDNAPVSPEEVNTEFKQAQLYKTEVAPPELKGINVEEAIKKQNG